MVRFGFTCPEGPTARWRVRRFALHESLSEPYRLELQLLAHDIDVAPHEFLGAACTVELERDGVGRRVHAVIDRVERLDAPPGYTQVRIFAGPALGLLAQRRNTRFWQGKTAPEILEEVLEGPLAEHGRGLRLQLDSAAYRPREYCVQFRESDLDFALRLMHEEGIVYAFDHEGDAELLVLLGTTVGAEDLAVPALRFVARDAGAAHQQAIDRLDWSHSLRTTSVVQRDWDWREPGPSYQHQRRGVDERNHDRERYDHDDRLLHADDGDVRARHKLETEVGPVQLGRGSSDVVELIPGRCFSLLHHPDHERDGRHFVLSVSHTGEAPEEDLHAQSGVERTRYANEFVCARPGAPFRSPQPPARPRVYGPQTAIVVGPESEEIHTDEHGRIKVRFHWDRISPPDDTASCWIRVAQTWAGPGWGGQFLPRIGMEVLVEFLDGDPDRPLVVGCVYNAVFRPPYALPDSKTRSGIKSESSPGGGGYNEISFEDAKGSEELTIHAQRDMNTRVLRDGGSDVGRDSGGSVGRDEKVSVGNNRTASVGVDESCSVGANQSISVGANQSTSVGGNQSTSVTGNQSISVTGNRTRDITGSDTVTVTGSESVSVTGATTHTRTAAVTETMLATRALTVVGASDETFAAARTVNVGAALTHNVAAKAALTAPLIESLCTLFKVEAGAGIEMSTVKAQVGAVTIALTASGSIVLSCGGSAIQIDPGGITLNAGTIKIAGGSVDITGGIVKIN